MSIFQRIQKTCGSIAFLWIRTTSEDLRYIGKRLHLLTAIALWTLCGDAAKVMNNFGWWARYKGVAKVSNRIRQCHFDNFPIICKETSIYNTVPRKYRCLQQTTNNYWAAYSCVTSVRPSHRLSFRLSFLTTFRRSVLQCFRPSVFPSFRPSFRPSVRHSVLSSFLASFRPSIFPSVLPSVRPSVLPSVRPSFLPSFLPSVRPSVLLSFRPFFCSSVRLSFRPSFCWSFLSSVLSSVLHSFLPFFRPCLTTFYDYWIRFWGTIQVTSESIGVIAVFEYLKSWTVTVRRQGVCSIATKIQKYVTSSFRSHIP